MSNNDNLHELAEQFEFDTERHDPHDRIPPEIQRVMEYIDENTGLLGDYNDGVVRLVEGGRKIQWYPRGRTFSAHDDLLHWVQQEADDVMIAVVGSRQHENRDDHSAYIEIHPVSLWGYEQ